jgi:hypothetical protein
MDIASTTRPFGVLKVSKVQRIPDKKLSLKEVLYWTMPHRDVEPEVRRWRFANAKRVLDQVWRLHVMKTASAISGYNFMYGTLWVKKLDGLSGRETLYGIASFRVVTNAGRDEIVDEFDAATSGGFAADGWNFHGIGTGVGAEAATDTALGTELTTEYSPNSTRATGTQSQPTSDVYRTVGTNTLDSGTPAVTEHGVFNQAATGGGNLLDRSVFAACWCKWRWFADYV